MALAAANRAPLRVLVYPHDLHIGGSQINAIEIAARLNRLGHECILFGRSGPLVDMATELGLEFIASPDPGRRPSLRVAKVIASLIRDRSIDVVHGYEWPPALEAWMATQLARRAVAVGTVMSMAVAPFIPRTMPLVVGTEQIAAVERDRGRRLTAVIEPPVDLELNSPTAKVGADEFRARWGLTDGRLTVTTVTRLAHELKLEGLLVAIDEIPTMGPPGSARLVVVGDGPARETVAARAAAANERAGWDAVVLTGEIADPRAAYQTADIVLGMGGSALRALAFGKPLVVQGEMGFWRILTQETLEDFLWTGWYGVGASASSGPGALLGELTPLFAASALRDELGSFGRNVVEQRFGLDQAARRQLAVYRAGAGINPAIDAQTVAAVGAGAQFGKYVIGRKAAKLAGSRKSDDFNSRPIAATGLSRV